MENKFRSSQKHTMSEIEKSDVGCGQESMVREYLFLGNPRLDPMSSTKRCFSDRRFLVHIHLVVLLE